MKSGLQIVDNAARRSALVVRVVIIIGMLVPALVVVVLSFSNEKILAFPPHHWGFLEYRLLFGSSYWLQAIGQSFSIAIPVALLDILVGVPAAYVISRARFPGRGVLQAIGLAPLILPGVAYAIAMYTFFVQVHFIGSAIGLILAHVALGLPFVIIITTAALARMPADLELVAMTLGASRSRAMLGITFRLLLPAIGAAAIFAFTTSFDEATFVNFLGGPSVNTLPKAIFSSMRTGTDPVITAIATLLMVMTGIITTIASYLRRRSA